MAIEKTQSQINFLITPAISGRIPTWFIGANSCRFSISNPVLDNGTMNNQPDCVTISQKIESKLLIRKGMTLLWVPASLCCLLMLANMADGSAAARCSAIGTMPQFSCQTPSTPRQDRRSNKEVVSVVAFNAEWLFYSDGNGGPSTKCPALTDSGMCPWTSIAQAETHLSRIAQVLSALNADIIVLAEVQDCVVLQCVIEAMGDSTYKPFLIKGTDTATMQNVGLISRIDPEETVWRTDARATVYASESSCGKVPNEYYDSGVSKHFIARISVSGLPISVIGVHLLSKPTDPLNCIKREAQAAVLQQVVADEMSLGRDVIVLGDFNDYDAKVADINNNIPTSRVSQWIRYSKSGSLVTSNVVEKVSNQQQRYSDWWDKNSDCVITKDELSLIDHMFVSPLLFSNIASVSIMNSINNTCGTFQSDHYPIKATFRLSDVPFNVLDTESSSQTTPIFISLAVVVGVVLVVLLVGMAIRGALAKQGISRH